MNRIEFMTELAALLQDVPVEERREAMQYYNDYFDDAGEENEEQVISELGNPAKVAATIKADLGSQAGDYAEYSEMDIPTPGLTRRRCRRAGTIRGRKKKSLRRPAGR